MPRVEWRGAPNFAEVAEALKVPTDHIMAVMREGATYVTLYTPSLEGDEPPVYRAGLRRDGEGILRPVGVAHELPDFYKLMRSLVLPRLPQEDGEGGT